MSFEKRKRNKYSPEDFYNFGRQNHTTKQIAAHYGVTTSAVSQQLAKPEVRAAFEKGKAGSAQATETNAATVTENAATAALLPYAEIERRVLAAIDGHFCTESGIKNHAGFARTFDISEILNEMVAERRIRREKDSDVTTAYFRFNWKVKRFWRDGTAQGKLGIEFERGDGARLDRKSIGEVRMEIYRKLSEISELVKSL